MSGAAEGTGAGTGAGAGVDKVARVAAQNLALLDRETDLLLATAATLPPEAAGAPTLCTGWDAAHLLTHVARNADALGNLLAWALDGQERPAYASEESRAADIVQGAARPWPQIVEDVRASAERLRQGAGELAPAGRLEAVVRTRTGTAVAAHQVVSMRILEVVLHHADLQRGYTLDDAEPGWVARTLRRGLRQWEARGDAPGLTLAPTGGEPLTLGGGGPVVAGTPGRLLLWLARGQEAGLRTEGALPEPPPWG